MENPPVKTVDVKIYEKYEKQILHNEHFRMLLDFGSSTTTIPTAKMISTVIISAWRCQLRSYAAIIFQ